MNLKKIIKEEIEDFTWMIDEPLNPWDEYDMIIFDQKPTKEEINNYIELALNTKNPENKESWEIGRKEDLKLILNYFKKYGGAILEVNEYKNLVYGEPTYVNRNPSRYNSIKYSQLVNKKINESKEYDLEWIKNTNPISVGTVFRPVYERSPEQAFYYVIESIDEDIITFRYPTTPNGDHTEMTTRGIITTHDLLNKIAEGKISIIDNITESEDLKWIQDIEPDLKVRVNDLREGLRVKVNTNKEDYGVFFHNDLRYYMEQSGGGEGTVRYWSTPDGNNTWVNVEWDNGRRNPYPLHEEYDIYSLLIVIDQPLTESEEEDDWAWARGPIWVDDKIRLGDRIKVYNKGTYRSFINWLGMYSDNYVAGDYGENIEGIVSRVGSDEFSLEVKNADEFEDSIAFPYKKDMEYMGMSNEDYYGLDFSYEFIPEPI
jgi:hypothetical protein